MAKPFLKPLVVMTIASSIILLASANSTFAQVSFGESVLVPDLAIPASIVIDPKLPSNEPPGSRVMSFIPSPPLALNDPAGEIELKTGGAADAHEVALVSLALRQLTLAKTPQGAKQVAAQINAQTYKWSAKQMSCLDSLWSRESHWNFKARNRRSGATGIAQALPAEKMSVVSADWRTNPVTQIKWGLLYIKLRYGNPCQALAHSHWSGNY